MTNEETKELIKLAARAVGIVLGKWSAGANAFLREEIGESYRPHYDNDDSRSLQVALRINVNYFRPHNKPELVEAQFYDVLARESLGDNPELATCMAVLKVAAEIQRRKENDYQTRS